MALTTDSTGRVLGGRYRLISRLGTGASANVFLAEDLMLQRHVAVKLLQPALVHDDGFLRRFQAEARAAGSLNHPHVMRVFDWGEDEDGPYLVLEFLGGGSLRQMLDRHGPLSPAQAAAVGVQAAQGLAYAHSRGIVHRDVKPANLLFDEEGRVRVADFGVARALAGSSWTEPPGAVIGTAMYASPEQAQGQPVHGQADVYGLALVLYESVTGALPFVADTAVATLTARLGRRLPPHGALGPLEPVLAWAADPDEASRPGAVALERQLRVAADRLPAPTPLPLPVPGDEPAPAGDDLTGVAPAVGQPDAGGAGGGARRPGPGLIAGTAAAAGGLAGAAEWLAAQPAAAAPPASHPTAVGPGHAGPGGTTVAGPGPAGTAVAGALGPPTVGTPPPPTVAQRAGNGPVSPASARRRRRRWPWLVALLGLALLLAAGSLYAVRTKLFTPSHPVPHLLGLELSSAEQATSGDHFSVSVAARRYSTTVSAGRVLHQSPAPGSSLKEGDVVDVTVSKGLPPETVPSLLGLDCPSAQRALAVANLYGTCPPQSEQYSSSVPSGQVVTWSVTGKDRPTVLPWHTTVTLAISKGPQPVPVPSVLGESYSAATSTLTQAGFKVGQAHGNSTSVPAGQAIGTNPPVGQPTPVGSTVTVVLSDGPPMTTVPSGILGQSLQQAESLLQQAGLKVGSVSGPSNGVVSGVAPGGGQSVPQGSAVGVTLSRGGGAGSTGSAAPTPAPTPTTAAPHGSSGHGGDQGGGSGNGKGQ